MLTKQFEFKREIKKLQKGDKKLDIRVKFYVGSIASGDKVEVICNKLQIAVSYLQSIIRDRQYTIDIGGRMFIGDELVTGEVEPYMVSTN